jgi:hypothetical protein
MLTESVRARKELHVAPKERCRRFGRESGGLLDLRAGNPANLHEGELEEDPKVFPRVGKGEGTRPRRPDDSNLIVADAVPLHLSMHGGAATRTGFRSL